MLKDRPHECLDVVGQDVVATVNQCERLRGTEQCRCPPGTDAEFDLRMVSLPGRVLYSVCDDFPRLVGCDEMSIA